MSEQETTEIRFDDDELIQLDLQEAKNKLNSKELERYNELKTEDLNKSIEDHKTDKAKNVSEGLATLVDAAEQELTETVYFGDDNQVGIEFFVDPDIEDYRKVRSIQKMQDREIDSLDTEEHRKIKDNVLELLADASVNYSKSDWEEKFGGAGLRTIGHVANKAFEHIELEMEEKKRR